MDKEQLQHLEEMLRIYHKRLRPLERQEAMYGPRTMPDVLIEIEELKEKIADIEAQLQVDRTVGTKVKDNSTLEFISIKPLVSRE